MPLSQNLKKGYEPYRYSYVDYGEQSCSCLTTPTFLMEHGDLLKVRR